MPVSISPYSRCGDCNGTGRKDGVWHSASKEISANEYAPHPDLFNNMRCKTCGGRGVTVAGGKRIKEE